MTKTAVTPRSARRRRLARTMPIGRWNSGCKRRVDPVRAGARHERPPCVLRCDVRSTATGTPGRPTADSAAMLPCDEPPTRNRRGRPRRASAHSASACSRYGAEGVVVDSALQRDVVAHEFDEQVGPERRCCSIAGTASCGPAPAWDARRAASPVARHRRRAYGTRAPPVVGWPDERCSHAAPGRGVTTVVVAPNAFKGSLDGHRSGRGHDALPRAVVLPGRRSVVRPMADGGDGSVDALLTAGFQPSRRAPCACRDGRIRARRPSPSRGDEAVVELANTCGLVLTPESARHPWTASTLGLGRRRTRRTRRRRGAHRDLRRRQRLDRRRSRPALRSGWRGSSTPMGSRPTWWAVAGVHRVDRPRPVSIPDLRDVELPVATDVDSPLFGPTAPPTCSLRRRAPTPPTWHCWTPG